MIESALLWLLNIVNPGVVILISAFVAFAAAFGLNPVVVTDENGFAEIMLIHLRRSILIFMFFCFTLLPAVVYWASQYQYGDLQYWDAFLGEVQHAAIKLWPVPFLFYIVPLLVSIIYYRKLKPAASRIFRRWRTRQSGDELSDIRVEKQKLQPKTYNPQKYYKLESHFFWGLDKNDKPIYEDDDSWKKRNKKFLGPTQTGKGVVQGLLMDQAIRKGYTIFCVNPKPDDFFYDIIRESCETAGRQPPIVLDLNGVGSGQYGPFLHGTDRQRWARFLWACGLNDTGTDADFYKVTEREILAKLMKNWDGSIPSLHKLLHPKSPVNGVSVKDIFEKTGRTRGYVNDWITHSPLCAKVGRGLDIERCIKENRVVYIEGSIDDPLVLKMANLLVMDFVQTMIRVGSPNSPYAHVYACIDEVKFLVSDVLAKGAATILSKGSNMSIAYQTVNDLLDLDDKSLNADAISQGLEVNTRTTLSYQAADYDTAEWASKLSGTIQKNVTGMEMVTRNKMGGEEWDEQTRLGKVEENLLHENMLLSLPPRVAAYYQPEEQAKLCYTCWVPVKELKGLPPKKKTTEPSKKVNNNQSKNTAKTSTQSSRQKKPEGKIKKAQSKPKQKPKPPEPDKEVAQGELDELMAFIDGKPKKSKLKTKN